MDNRLERELNKAINEFRLGNLVSAEKLALRLLNQNKKFLPALIVLGLINAMYGKHELAVKFFRDAESIEPKNASIQFNLAKALSQSGRHKEALLNHELAFNLDPNNPDILLNYAHDLIILKKHNEALNLLLKALELKPNYLEVILNIASTFNHMEKFDESIKYCDYGINLNPNFLKIYFVKGRSLKYLKRYEEAVAHYDKALALNPDFADAWSNKGSTLHELKRYEEAVAHYDKALALNPDFADAWSNKGSTLHELKRYEEAVAHYDKALALNPDFADAWSNKGSTLHELKRYEEAVAHYDKALALNPDFADAWSNKGSTLHELKRYEEAVAHYDKALALNPDFADAWSNKGSTLHELKRYEEAVAHYDKALALNPDFADAWSNKGSTLHELKRYEEAVAHYDKALALNPDFADAWSNKGSTLHELKRYEEAVAHYDKALALNPDFADAWSNKGSTLHELKRYEEAVAHYDKALALNPDLPLIFGMRTHLKMIICDWENFEEDANELREKIESGRFAVPPFASLSIFDSPVLHQKSAEIYTKNKYLLNNILGSFQSRNKREKLRIGVFSADFHDHPVGYLSVELFELINKNQFELYGFSFGSASNHPQRQRIINSFFQFYDIENKSDLEVANLSRNLEIDIAIDLNGHTRNARTGIFALRAAPIQINYLGYAGTLGTNYIDYIIADKTVITEKSESYFNEKIIYLPSTYIVDDSKRIPQSPVKMKSDYGLPEKKIIFCAFGNSFKFNTSVLQAWISILNQVNDSVLWVSENNHFFQKNLSTYLGENGINPKRLIFATRINCIHEHLTRMSFADIFLDTFPFNAHTTALDAIKAELPIVSLLGKSFSSRVSASILNSINMPELISESVEKYIATAVDLAKSQKFLHDTKTKLRENSKKYHLFDTSWYAKNLEFAFLEAIRRYDHHLPIEDIRIS